MLVLHWVFDARVVIVTAREGGGGNVGLQGFARCDEKG